MQAGERGSMGRDRESGSTLPKLLGYFDPGTSSWKTSQSSEPEGSMLSPKTWPKSGMTSGGRLYELRTSGRLITEAAGSGSRLPLFPTPKASDGPHGGPNQRSGKGEYDALPSMVVHLLPTPTARDWKSGASRQHGKNSRPLNEVVLTLNEPEKFFGTPRASSANGHGRLDNSKNRTRLETQVVLLKTPTANLGANGAPQHPDKRKAGGHGPTLDDEVTYLIPEPDGLVQDWGEYEPAIRRQEAWIGRPAPIPTEIGPRGGRRLSARFAEWLMGLPEGWVTDTAGLSRGNHLHAIGNGVVPRQAFAAFDWLMSQAQPTHEESKWPKSA